MTTDEIIIDDYIKVLLDSFNILSNENKALDKPIFKQIKKQTLCAVIYELSLHKVHIPTGAIKIENEENTELSLKFLGFFIAFKSFGNSILFLGSILSIISILLLTYFTNFQNSSTYSIGFAMFFVFYSMKKHFDLCIYEKFATFLKNISAQKSAQKISNQIKNEQNLI